jgi:alpha-D-ribose 1-methylphosphonate 5-triphosphate synthase subunit PhnH
MPMQAGLIDPVFDSQAVFRTVLAALANPGKVRVVPASPPDVAGCPPAAMALMLTLLDYETPLWLSQSLQADQGLREHIAFHTGAPKAASPARCAFALVDARRDPLDLELFHPGEAEYPDRSTTVIAILPVLAGGPLLSIAGPGIRSVETLGPTGLPDDFASQWRANRRRYPLGVDVMLVAGAEMIGLPRTACLLEGDA